MSIRVSPSFSVAKLLASRDALGRVAHCLTETDFNCLAHGINDYADFWVVHAIHPSLKDAYLFAACNSKGAQSGDELVNTWLTPYASQSARNALRGCGLAISGYCSSDMKNPHMAVASKLPDGTWAAAQVDFRKDGDVVPRLAPEWLKVLQDWRGEVDGYNVLYMFPLPRGLEIPDSEEILEITEGERAGGFVTTQVMNAFARLIGDRPSPSRIHYARGIVIGPGQKIKTLADCMSGEFEMRKWFCNSSEYRQRYALHRISYIRPVKVFTQQDTERYEWELLCQVDLDLFPGLRNRRLVNLCDGQGVGGKWTAGKGDEYGERPSSESRRKLRFPNIVTTIPAIADLAHNGDRDVAERLRSYAVWYYPNIGSFILPFAGAQYTNRAEKFTDRDQWPEYHAIWADGMVRSPFVQMGVSIVKVISVKTTTGDVVDISAYSFDNLISFLFGASLLENFRLSDEDRVKKIVEDICQGVADALTESEKTELKTAFERLYPRVEQDKVGVLLSVLKKKNRKKAVQRKPLILHARKVGQKGGFKPTKSVLFACDYECQFCEVSGLAVSIRKAVSRGWDVRRVKDKTYLLHVDETAKTERSLFVLTSEGNRRRVRVICDVKPQTHEGEPREQDRTGEHIASAVDDDIWYTGTTYPAKWSLGKNKLLINQTSDLCAKLFCGVQRGSVLHDKVSAFYRDTADFVREIADAVAGTKDDDDYQCDPVPDADSSREYALLIVLKQYLEQKQIVARINELAAAK